MALLPLLPLLLEFALFSSVLTSDPIIPGSYHDFLGFLRTTSGNDTKDCTVFFVSPSIIIAPIQCVHIDKHKTQNLTYQICYNSERCITDVKNEDCRTLQYTYKPKDVDYYQEYMDSKSTVVKVVDMADVAVFELTEGHHFKHRERAKFPYINPSARVLDMKGVQGLVISCNGVEIISDMYEVNTQPGTDEPNSSIDEYHFYGTSINQTENKELKKSFVKSGAAFVVLSEDGKDLFLKGIMSEVDETPQEFVFVPSCFEEVPEDVDQVSGNGVKVRRKRGIRDTVKATFGRDGKIHEMFRDYKNRAMGYMGKMISSMMFPNN